MEKQTQCKNCNWYFPTQTLCYEQLLTTPPTFTCPQATPDKGLNHHSEHTKECDC